MSLKEEITKKVSTGRIGEIGEVACSFFEVESPSDLTDEQKLNSLCESLCIDEKSLDEIIANSPEVSRTVKGHAFEIVFDKIMKKNGIECKDVGGDSDIDRSINGYSLQLKTPFVNGCSEDVVSYKTHKTHGAKSERESMDYYHRVSTFADYLVGLVRYDPFEVVIIPKEELPRVEGEDDFIQSPMFISLKDRNYINQYERLKIYGKVFASKELVVPSENEILPLSSELMKIKSDYILEAVFKTENFRIWDMNMRGFIREKSLHNLFESSGINVYPTTVTGLERPEKSDIVLKNTKGNYVRFQVKGLTLSGCVFNGTKSVLDCETQLSRGRVNDHPTQSRLYKKTDFDYLIIAMDPPYTNRFYKELYNTEKYMWTYYCIPTEALSKHHQYANRISSHQHIAFKDILKYKIDKDWLSNWN